MLIPAVEAGVNVGHQTNLGAPEGRLIRTDIRLIQNRFLGESEKVVGRWQSRRDSMQVAQDGQSWVVGLVGQEFSPDRDD
jgi:hypothetical protein